MFPVISEVTKGSSSVSSSSSVLWVTREEREEQRGAERSREGQRKHSAHVSLSSSLSSQNMASPGREMAAGWILGASTHPKMHLEETRNQAESKIMEYQELKGSHKSHQVHLHVPCRTTCPVRKRNLFYQCFSLGQLSWI